MMSSHKNGGQKWVGYMRLMCHHSAQLLKDEHAATNGGRHSIVEHVASNGGHHSIVEHVTINGGHHSIVEHAASNRGHHSIVEHAAINGGHHSVVEHVATYLKVMPREQNISTLCLFVHLNF